MTPQLILGLVALGVTVFAQFGTIIWFASRVSTTMMFQTAALERLTEAVKALQEFRMDVEKRVAVIEDRHDREDVSS